MHRDPVAKGGRISMGKRVTIQQIAELAGVSRGTVDRVLNHRSYVSEAVRARVEAAGCRYVETLEEVLGTSDFVSLHIPLLPSTRQCIGARELSLMKPTAFLINTARGAVVDEQALADAVNQGVIAGAGVDVYGTEPAVLDNPVFTAPRILCTPHSAALTPDSWARMACGAVEGCYAVCQGKEWPGWPIRRCGRKNLDRTPVI